MLNFWFPTINDRYWIGLLTKMADFNACEYSVGNIIFWSKLYNTKVTRYKNFFIAKCYSNPESYSFPIGFGDYNDAFAEIEAAVKKENKPLVFHSLTSEMCEIIEKSFPNLMEYREVRDDFDYIYSTDNLVNLSGKKYHSKRNHIAKFNKEYNWIYEDINSRNIDELINFNECFKNSCKGNNDLLNEIDISTKMLIAFECMNFIGGLIRVNDKIVAYTMGERLNSDTFCIHVEKALKEYVGAYSVINKEFVSRKLTGYKYVNREDDVGSAGLRKSKLSYHPEILLGKYCAFGR